MIRSALMNVMTAAVLKAGRGLKRDFGEVENLQVSVKGPGDFVTAADKRSEKTLFEELSKARPGYGFVMEEGGTIEGTDQSHTWHIDPLDGTTNFLHGLPIFAISVGLEREGHLVAGVVYNPATDDMYFAERGQGAYLNNRRLRVAARRDIAEALVELRHPGARPRRAPSALQGRDGGGHGAGRRAAPLRRGGARPRLCGGRRLRRLLGARREVLGRRGRAPCWCARPAASCRRPTGTTTCSGRDPSWPATSTCTAPCWTSCAACAEAARADGRIPCRERPRAGNSPGGAKPAKAVGLPSRPCDPDARGPPSMATRTDPFRLSSPRIFLVRMVVFLILAGFVALILNGRSPGPSWPIRRLNGLILGVLLVGIVLGLRQVFRLFPEIRWANSAERPRGAGRRDRRCCSPRWRRSWPTGAPAPRHHLDGDAARHPGFGRHAARRIARDRPLSDRPADLPRPARHLLGSARDRRVDRRRDQVHADRRRLRRDVRRPEERPRGADRRHERVASPRRCSASPGSLVLGFLDLQAGQAQNRFYNRARGQAVGLRGRSRGRDARPRTGTPGCRPTCALALDRIALGTDQSEQPRRHGRHGQSRRGHPGPRAAHARRAADDPRLGRGQADQNTRDAPTCSSASPASREVR